MPGDAAFLRCADGPARGEPPIPAEVARRAVEWLVDLQAERVPPGSVDDWRRWRAAHPDHERAWQRIESVNGKLRHLAAPVDAAVVRAALTQPGSARRRQAVAGIAALLFAGGAAWAARDDLRWREWTADERSGAGERRRIVLDDGSAVEMNSGSAINLAFSPAERRLRLVAGEVLIRTAADAAGRPFLVETTQGRAQALGTRFSVRLLPGATDVAVFEGAVRVVPRDAAARSLVLQAGEQARYSREAVDAPQAADPDRVAWTDGFIVAKGMRLADFLSELGRHSARPLSCDPAAAELRVSGVYPLADVDKVLDTLAAALPLRVETVTRFWGPQTVRLGLASRRQAGGAGH